MKRYAIEKLKKHHRSPLFDKSLPVAFLWSPKAGCTVLTKWFFYQIGHLEKAMKINPSVHVYKGMFTKKYKSYKEIESGGAKIYKLVRNPYKRAVSSYFTIANYCYSKGIPNLPMEKDKQRITSMFYPLTSYKGISFKQFLYYLDGRGADYTLVDGHISKQYCPEEDYLSPKIIKLENFNKEINRLQVKYNLKQTPANVLSTPHSYTKKMRQQADFTPDTIITPSQFVNGSLPEYKELFDHETIQLCNHIFHDDFSHYNYLKKH
ncbi:sulfotransferase family 2 domain-containing protein [Rossellomorea oryzaecorticis]|jgi:Sulfotransferase family|uniref:Sulfotransferase family 2 domain-containing protein n=1 Tax=Rossellomorea oryzaecorticis TaxID=1396505 RepID=A0ABW8VKL5_9BACI|nr:sulfotransferase family 2 domain-containing protein [[Bacillus] enclensis]MBH9965390.1 sulfotransferase family 2 domain-containing protein [[Bacillus] enclensis]QWC24563.1 sulfotransferase family 2 domain-containing protein [Bacillus haikouensis]